MKQITKLDHNQVIKRSFNEQEDALDVTLKNLEMSIELDAHDGDSVQVAKKTQVFKSEGEVLSFEIDIQMIDKVVVYTDGLLEISPDGETYITLGTSDRQTLEVLGTKLKISSTEPKQFIIVGK
jgi:hypothetical protein